MKRLLIYLLIIITTSCNYKDTDAINNSIFTINVNASSGISTKVDIVDKNLYWSKGDKISMFALSSSSKQGSSILELNNVDAGLNVGKFKGNLAMEEEPNTCYFAYPYSINISFSNQSVFGIYDFSGQDGIYSPFMYSDEIVYSSNISCSFKHVGGIIKLVFPAGVYQDIVLAGNNNEKISKIKYDYTNATFSSVDDAVESITTTLSSSLTECYINVPPINFTKGFSLVITNLSGEKMYRSFNYDLGYNFLNSSGSLINIDLSSFTSFDISANVSAEHLMNANNDLYGSKLSLQGVTVNGVSSKLADSWGVEVYDGNNSLVRSISDVSFADISSDFTQDIGSQTDYIPSGNYSIKPYVVISGNKVYGSTSSVNVPAPNLDVTLDAKSSYSYYLDGDITSANACDGSTIYFPANATKINIVPELVNSLGLSVSYNIDGGSIINASLNNNYLAELAINNQSWKQHNIGVTFSFDNKDYSKNANIDITGLPYNATPPTKNGSNPWAENDGKITWSSDRVELNYSAATYPMVSSPSFYIPADININLSTKIVRNYYWASVSKGNINVFTKVNSTENKLINRELARDAVLEGNYQGVMPFGCDGRWYFRYNYAATGPLTYIYYLILNYR